MPRLIIVCLSPASPFSHSLVLVKRYAGQETHHFLGKQSCYYTILVHRCSLLPVCPKRGSSLMPIFYCYTTLLCHAKMHFKGTIADSVPTWQATVVSKEQMC